MDLLADQGYDGNGNYDWGVVGDSEAYAREVAIEADRQWYQDHSLGSLADNPALLPEMHSESEVSDIAYNMLTGGQLGMMASHTSSSSSNSYWNNYLSDSLYNQKHTAPVTAGRILAKNFATTAPAGGASWLTRAAGTLGVVGVGLSFSIASWGQISEDWNSAQKLSGIQMYSRAMAAGYLEGGLSSLGGWAGGSIGAYFTGGQAAIETGGPGAIPGVIAGEFIGSVAGSVIVGSGGHYYKDRLFDYNPWGLMR